MDIEFIRRITLARHLYGLASSCLKSSNDLYLFSAVNIMQDAKEAFILAVADHVDAQLSENTNFDKEFWGHNSLYPPAMSDYAVLTRSTKTTYLCTSAPPQFSLCVILCVLRVFAVHIKSALTSNTPSESAQPHPECRSTPRFLRSHFSCADHAASATAVPEIPSPVTLQSVAETRTGYGGSRGKNPASSMSSSRNAVSARRASSCRNAAPQ